MVLSYKKIKAIDEKVKVCFLSAVYDLRDYNQANADLIDAIERGKECFIDKPIGGKKLLSQIYKTINPNKRDMQKVGKGKGNGKEF